MSLWQEVLRRLPKAEHDVFQRLVDSKLVDENQSLILEMSALAEICDAVSPSFTPRSASVANTRHIEQILLEKQVCLNRSVLVFCSCLICLITVNSRSYNVKFFRGGCA